LLEKKKNAADSVFIYKCMRRKSRSW